MIVPTLVLVITLAFYYRSWTTRETLPTGTQPLPGPTGIPYFGNLFQLGLLQHLTFTKWAEKYGPIFLITLGVKRWLIISDPNIAHELMVKRGANYSNRDTTVISSEILHPGNIGIVPSSGEYWRKLRQIVHTALARKSVESYTSFIETESVELMRDLYGKTMDPAVSCRQFALNIIYTVLYGKRFTSSEDPRSKELMRLGLGFINALGRPKFPFQ
ncbi:cytochrome P450 [Jimgerdemannia flammicorona]|uniref:Cytochrome P450 n=1 Tax=Jimgerdemannia flammicorona TaxID=994334 RepID=A0A433CZP6_9FUNG|nr:cytochrome P450 [Jimgerdemannia flammicorona]